MSNTTFPQSVYLCDRCEELYGDHYDVTETGRTAKEKHHCEHCGDLCYGARYTIRPKSKIKKRRKAASQPL